MTEEKIYELSEDEYKLVCFYRELPENKRDKFKELIISLRKVLIEEKEK